MSEINPQEEKAMKVQGIGGIGKQAAIGVCVAVVTLISVAATADQVRLNVALGKPVLLADKKQTAHLKIGLTGFEMKGEDSRVPVNVAIVLDKSGSMSGEKIRKAKEGAVLALRRLNSNDIVSVVAYDHTVRVVVPATKLHDRASIEAEIEKITAGGSTALFAGVSKGAQEVRKFIDEDRVNRIILLSDGLANVGPSSPAELGDLGASLVKDGISVTTIGLGLGYNEDLMAKLAFKSDGNHYFAEEANDLARLYKAEFGDVLSVVAQEVVIRINCARGIRPVRLIGREGDINSQEVVVLLNQLYSEQEKYSILEVEIPATKAGRTRDVATVEVTYGNMQTRTTDELTSKVAVTFTGSAKVVEANTDHEAMVSIVEQIATTRNRLAMTLRDEGRVEEARDLLRTNATYLNDCGEKYNSQRLLDYGSANDGDARNLDAENWDRQRKEMQSWQMYNFGQQYSR
jgi:Ca-activated chloride channel family protein